MSKIAQELNVEEIISENPKEPTRIFKVIFASGHNLLFTIMKEDREQFVSFLESLGDVDPIEQINRMVKYLRSQGLKESENQHKHDLVWSSLV